MRIFVFALGLAACSGETILIDPPVIFEEEADDLGPPGVEIGVYEAGAFKPIGTDGTLYIIHGFQGGEWTMPGLKTTGLLGTVKADAKLTLDGSGEAVGRIQGAEERIEKLADGSGQILNIQIPVFHPDSPGSGVEDLYGKSATLEVTLTDVDGRSGSASIHVQLAEG